MFHRRSFRFGVELIPVISENKIFPFRSERNWQIRLAITSFRSRKVKWNNFWASPSSQPIHFTIWFLTRWHNTTRCPRQQLLQNHSHRQLATHRCPKATPTSGSWITFQTETDPSWATAQAMSSPTANNRALNTLRVRQDPTTVCHFCSNHNSTTSQQVHAK